MKKGSRYAVEMASYVYSTLGFLHIPPIIQKSEWPSRWSFCCPLTSFRIALATIRNLGLSPCPRCLVPDTDLHKLGMALDIKRRKTRARTDNSQRQSKIKGALDRIHKHLGAVLSEKNEDDLKPESLVAILVRWLTLVCHFALTLVLERLLPTSPSWIRLLQDAPTGSTSRGRARCLENDFYTSSQALGRTRPAPQGRVGS